MMDFEIQLLIVFIVIFVIQFIFFIYKYLWFSYFNKFRAHFFWFFKLIDSLGKGVSFSHNKVKRNCVGEIRGALLINQYAKEIAAQHFPRRYECVQKKKTYCTPENILIYYAMLRIREIMELFLWPSFWNFLNPHIGKIP